MCTHLLRRMMIVVTLLLLVLIHQCSSTKEEQQEPKLLRTRHQPFLLNTSAGLPYENLADVSSTWFEGLDLGFKEYAVQKMMTIGGSGAVFRGSLFQNNTGDNEYFAEAFQSKKQNEIPRHRKLAVEFSPLSCNSLVNLVTCSTTLSSLIGVGLDISYNPVVIPCGSCVTVDTTDGSTLTLLSGLNIEGKLYFPPSASLTIRTTHVIVQGILEMETPAHGNKVKINLFGANPISFTPHEDNIGRCSPSCSVGKKPIVVAGGQLHISGVADSTCPSWTKLQDLTSSSDSPSVLNQVTVGAEAARCWNAGDSLLITSPDWDMKNKFETTIVSINEDQGIIITADPLPDYFEEATEKATPDFAVEVASLSRRIVFEAENDDSENNGLIGGHLIIYYTPSVEQHLEGVEFVSFGQQGNIGRYPIHFHMCQDSSGSFVSNNVIRNSNQRCIVIHGTDNVNIRNNIAYDIAGHCFFTEDGIEQGNIFERNLGVNIRKPTFVIPGENDHVPSTFWITNPTNSWIDNVAAGSEHQGFWFDTRQAVRGESMLLPHGLAVVPVDSSILVFRGNVAHGHLNAGIAFYSPGWRPVDGGQLIENCKSYRNFNTGYFIHANQNIALVGCLAADNLQSFRFFRNADIRFDNLRIIGHSPNYVNVLTKTNSVWFCTNGNSEGSIVGMQVHAWRMSGQRGLHVNSIEFSHFDDPSCPGVAIEMNPLQSWKKVYDGMETFTNISLKGDFALTIDACDAVSERVVSIALQDVDGTLGPTGEAGFIVSNDPVTVTFANGLGCSSFEDGGCVLFCPEACLRRISILTSNTYSTEVIAMVISDGIKNATGEWTRFEWLDEVDPQSSSRVYHDGFYGLALPEGNYEISFRHKMTGETVWPSYAELQYEEAPDCLGYAEAISLTPPNFDVLRCSELVKEGTFESGHDAYERFGSWQSNALSLEFVSPGFAGSQYALKMTGNTGQVFTFGGQWLDASCFEPWTKYTFSAMIRLVDEFGNERSCQVGKNGDCPEARLEFYFGEPVPFRQTNLFEFGSIEGNDTVAGWYQMTGTFLLDDTLDAAKRVLLRFWQPAALDYIIDDVSILAEKLEAPTSTPSGSPSGTARPTSSAMPTPDLTNLALMKPAEQSNINHNSGPEKAVDGNTDGIWSNGSVMHTGVGNNFWTVNLLSPSYISIIKVYNRLDFGQEYLNNFELEILNESQDIIQTRTFSGDKPTVVEFNLQPLVLGQYVRIRSETILMLAEVEVYGFTQSLSIDAPTSTPSPTGVFCFSGETSVIVENRNAPVLMKHVRVGDRILSEHNKFQSIYSFGHRDGNAIADFVQLLPSGIELSKDHMVFVEGRGAIPVSLVVVGDHLMMADSHSKNTVAETVTEIRLITRQGVYAPFTVSGTLIVNGILSSSYIALQESSRLRIGTYHTPFSLHWMSHAFLTPYRIWCRWLMAQNDGRLGNKDGSSAWSESSYTVAAWMLTQNIFILSCLLVPFLFVLSLLVIFEFLVFGSASVWVATFVLGFVIISFARREEEAEENGGDILNQSKA